MASRAIEMAQASLQQAMQEEKARASVEGCLREMMADVELAQRLEEKLSMSQEIQFLKTKLVEQEWAVEEARAEQKGREEKQMDLADQFVQDVWTLSRKMEDLKEFKAKHDNLLLQYDEVVAKLVQAEEDLKEVREGRGVIASQSMDTQDSLEVAVEPIATVREKAEQTKTPIAPVMTPEMAPVTVPVEPTATVVTLPPSAEVKIPLEEKSMEEPEDKPSTEDTKQESGDVEKVAHISPNGGENVEEPVEVEPAAVSLEVDSEPEAPTFETMETKILMQIFAYLDALDILNTAQVNVSMYSRIDSLFGLGNGADAATDGDNSTIATIETAPPQQPVLSSPPPSSYPQQRASGAASVTGTTTTAAAAATTASNPSATIPYRRSESNPVATTQSSAANIAGEGIRSFFNILQPARNALAPSSPPRFSSATSTPTRRPRSSSSSENPPMNAAMANSMASKLTDAELNAIILMTERLRQKEALAEKLTQERQDLEAKLDGTESVKQFLINKVREMEESLSLQEDNETKVAQQIASDQEVIAFLDNRVQQLESDATNLKKEQEEMRLESEHVQEQAKQKAMVMGDMLQFEREKWSESEREWKATKKVLVKEVKHCRAQIAALQAERDGYREQNDVLRKAIISTPLSVNVSREHTFA